MAVIHRGYIPCGRIGQICHIYHAHIHAHPAHNGAQLPPDAHFHAPGQRPRVPVSIADGYHGQLTVPLEDLGAAVTHRRPFGQGAHRGHPAFQGEHRLQLGLIALPHGGEAVQGQSGPDHIQMGTGILQNCRAGGAVADLKFDPPGLQGIPGL